MPRPFDSFLGDVGDLKELSCRSCHGVESAIQVKRTSRLSRVGGHVAVLAPVEFPQVVLSVVGE